MASENQKCVGVVFSDRAYKDIQTETYDKDPVETGGILLGHVLSTGHWVVVEVIPPGNNSTHQYAYFEYDEHFVNRVADPVANKYEQKLELLGLWHRHPGSMDFFSGTDDGTNIKFAELNPAYGAISGLVNIDPRFRMTMYHVDSPLDYTKVETFVGDDIIPAELLKLKEGVTFEEIDAIKKPKTRSEQQPAASQQQTSQQTRQTTPNREEPRRTTPSRENHEKPQVVIQRPETGTDVFKKLILGHPKAFFASVFIFFGIIAFITYFVATANQTKKEEERQAQEYDENIKPIADDYEKETNPDSNNLGGYIAKLEAKKVGLNDKNKKKVDELIETITNRKVEVEQKEQEAKKQEEERTKAAKEEAERQARLQAASKAEQNEYNNRIKPLYEAYEKEKNPDSQKLQSHIDKLSNLKPKLKYDANKNRIGEMVKVIEVKKNTVKAEEEEREKKKEDTQRAEYNEYSSTINDVFNDCDTAKKEKSLDKLEACLTKLSNLDPQYEGNKNKVKTKKEEINQEKTNLEKQKKDEDCKKLLKDNSDYKSAGDYYKNKLSKGKDGDNYQEHLTKLNNLMGNESFKECKTEKEAIKKLIGKIDPDKLKDALGNIKKEQCEKQCESYKVLKAINGKVDTYKDVLKKFEEETCKDVCKQ